MTDKPPAFLPSDLFTDDPEELREARAEARSLAELPAEQWRAFSDDIAERDRLASLRLEQSMAAARQAEERRRIELAEEEERARLRVREQWERERQEPAAAVSAPAKPKPETQADRIKECVSKCEQRAAKNGAPFDRSNMPGTKAEFLDLLHALDAGLRSIKTVESLDRYLSVTGCKWPLNAGKQSSAAPLYARLFPEAHIRAPGAVSPQRRKA